MKQFMLVLLTLILLTLGSGCAMFGGSKSTASSSKNDAPHEAVHYRLPTGLMPVHVGESGMEGSAAQLTRMVLTGESIESWTEALEVISSPAATAPPTVDGTYKSMTDARKRNCPESTFNLLGQDSTSALWETTTLNCPAGSTERSLTGLLYGQNELFTLIYTQKAGEIPPEVREQWIDILSKADLQKVE